MVTLVKKKSGKKTVYYLRHNIRVKGKYKTVEKYLGSRLPKNIESVMLNFFRQVHAKEYKHLERLKSQAIAAKKKMPRSIAEKNLKDFGIRFTYNTNRIEGGTLSLRDTFTVISGGVSPENKPLSDVKEAESHYKVFTEMLKTKKINRSVILRWHYEMFKDTQPGIAGKLRDYQVKISGSKFKPPSPVELNALLRDFFRWLDKNLDRYDPMDLAGLAHLKFVTIHPFGDGNGRMSRLIMNWILWKRRYPMFVIQYKNRNRYYSALERAQIKENSFVFLGWFVRNYIKFARTELS